MPSFGSWFPFFGARDNNTPLHTDHAIGREDASPHSSTNRLKRDTERPTVRPPARGGVARLFHFLKSDSVPAHLEDALKAYFASPGDRTAESVLGALQACLDERPLKRESAKYKKKMAGVFRTLLEEMPKMTESVAGRKSPMLRTRLMNIVLDNMDYLPNTGMVDAVGNALRSNDKRNADAAYDDALNRLYRSSEDRITASPPEQFRTREFASESGATRLPDVHLSGHEPQNRLMDWLEGMRGFGAPQPTSEPYSMEGGTVPDVPPDLPERGGRDAAVSDTASVRAALAGGGNSVVSSARFTHLPTVSSEDGADDADDAVPFGVSRTISPFAPDHPAPFGSLTSGSPSLRNVLSPVGRHSGTSGSRTTVTTSEVDRPYMPGNPPSAATASPSTVILHNAGSGPQQPGPASHSTAGDSAVSRGIASLSRILPAAPGLPDWRGALERVRRFGATIGEANSASQYSPFRSSLPPRDTASPSPSVALRTPSSVAHGASQVDQAMAKWSAWPEQFGNTFGTAMEFPAWDRVETPAVLSPVTGDVQLRPDSDTASVASSRSPVTREAGFFPLRSSTMGTDMTMVGMPGDVVDEHDRGAVTSSIEGRSPLSTLPVSALPVVGTRVSSSMASGTSPSDQATESWDAQSGQTAMDFGFDKGAFPGARASAPAMSSPVTSVMSLSSAPEDNLAASVAATALRGDDATPQRSSTLETDDTLVDPALTAAYEEHELRRMGETKKSPASKFMDMDVEPGAGAAGDLLPDSASLQQPLTVHSSPHSEDEMARALHSDTASNASDYDSASPDATLVPLPNVFDPKFKRAALSHISERDEDATSTATTSSEHYSDYAPSQPPSFLAATEDGDRMSNQIDASAPTDGKDIGSYNGQYLDRLDEFSVHSDDDAVNEAESGVRQAKTPYGTALAKSERTLQGVVGTWRSDVASESSGASVSSTDDVAMKDEPDAVPEKQASGSPASPGNAVASETTSYASSVAAGRGRAHQLLGRALKNVASGSRLWSRSERLQNGR